MLIRTGISVTYIACYCKYLNTTTFSCAPGWKCKNYWKRNIQKNVILKGAVHLRNYAYFVFNISYLRFNQCRKFSFYSCISTIMMQKVIQHIINKILSLENQFSDSQIIFEIEVSFFNPDRKLEAQHSVSI